MRLIDLLYSARYLTPWAFVTPRFPPATGQAGPDGDAEAAVSMFERLRNRARQSPIYSLDAPAQFFLQHRRDAPFLPADLLPACRLPEPRCFLEMRRGSTHPPIGPAQFPAAALPERWGFYCETIDPVQWEQICGANGCIPHPQTRSARALYLFVSPRDEYVTGPLATYYVVDDKNGALLDNQIPVFPGFPLLSGQVADEALFQNYLRELLWPVLFGVSTLTAAGSTAATLDWPEAVQAKRQRQGKRTLFPFQRVRAEPALEQLRYQGQAGLQGIVAALRAAPAALAPPPTPNMEPILIWVPGKE